jgi:hypothetical protein
MSVFKKALLSTLRVVSIGGLATTGTYAIVTRKNEFQPVDAKTDKLVNSPHFARLNPEKNPIVHDFCVRKVPLSKIKPELRENNQELTRAFCAGVWSGEGRFPWNPRECVEAWLGVVEACSTFTASVCHVGRNWAKPEKPEKPVEADEDEVDEADEAGEAEEAGSRTSQLTTPRLPYSAQRPRLELPKRYDEAPSLGKRRPSHLPLRCRNPDYRPLRSPREGSRPHHCSCR